MNNRIAEIIVALGMKRIEFAKKLGISSPFVSELCNGTKKASDRTIADICREFSVSEEWLRTGEGEMFVPKEEDALDELVKQYGLSDGDHMLIEKFLKLKSVERQAVITYMQDVVSALNAGATYSEPAVDSKMETTTQTEPDIMSELAELRRQNQELAAEVAAMKEEDELFWHPDTGSLV